MNTLATDAVEQYLRDLQDRICTALAALDVNALIADLSKVPEAIRGALAAKGHPVMPVDHVAGGMGAILFDGARMTGAGFGGCVIALAPGREEAVLEGWRSLGVAGRVVEVGA